MYSRLLISTASLLFSPLVKSWLPLKRRIFTSRPDYREGFSSTPELEQGRNEEHIFKVWMSLKECYETLLLFTMKYCTISDIIMGKWCYTAICFEGRTLWVFVEVPPPESFIHILNHFRSTSFCRIWIAEEGMCSKANVGQPGPYGRLPSVWREQWGLGLCCNPLVTGQIFHL